MQFDEGRYQRFDTKYDNSNEVISADHINALQGASERTQQGIFRAQDRDFLDKALFILEHHRLLNGMWIDLLENTSRTDLPRSTQLVFSEVEQGVVFPDGSTAVEGYLFSKPYINPHGSNMKKVMVIAAGYTPDNTALTIEISNNNTDWYPVPLQESEPLEIPTDGSRLYLRANFHRTNALVSPRLDAWAILFYDPKNDVITLPDGTEVAPRPGDGSGDEPNSLIKLMHSQLMGVTPDDHHPQQHSHDGTDGSGLISHSALIEVGPDDHHPKAHYHGQDGVPYVRLDQDVIGTLPLENLSYQMWTGRPGTTGLYFDPSMGDKLVYVKTPDDETYMFYDLVADRLDHTINIVQGIAVWEQLIFGDYTNGAGETTVVLQGTEKTHYDATDPMIQNEIAKVAAPAKPMGLVAVNTGTGGTVDLSWIANTELDLVGYNLYISTNGGTTWTKSNTTGILTGASHTVTGLVNGTTYSFALTAIDTTGFESHQSEVATAQPTFLDSITPDQVAGVNVNRPLPTELFVDWIDNTESDLDHYAVYMSSTGTAGSFTKIVDVPNGVTGHLQTGLLAGNQYYFYVTAFDASGNESVQSIIVSHVA